MSLCFQSESADVELMKLSASSSGPSLISDASVDYSFSQTGTGRTGPGAHRTPTTTTPSSIPSPRFNDGGPKHGARCLGLVSCWLDPLRKRSGAPSSPLSSTLFAATTCACKKSVTLAKESCRDVGLSALHHFSSSSGAPEPTPTS
uniref:Uncharacterized protein n=1 Tax=Knipowitschia caucasica TaxID=637954 RepID=A0AAV2JPC9_KNICA